MGLTSPARWLAIKLFSVGGKNGPREGTTRPAPPPPGGPPAGGVPAKAPPGGGKRAAARDGSRLARWVTNVVPVAAAAAATYLAWVWIQTSPMYRATFRVPDLFKSLWDLSAPGYGELWRGFFAAAVTASSISYLQVALSFLLVVAALRMLLCKIGDLGAGRGVVAYSGTATLALVASNTLPLLGMFSTIVGVVMADSLPKQELKMLIFGPSGLGILGLALAKVVYFIARERGA